MELNSEIIINVMLGITIYKITIGTIKIVCEILLKTLQKLELLVLEKEKIENGKN